ncbi:extracellular solute-binding protein [Paenibacillus sp.]|jgi:putative aldouronate transport system substrate-binding protein|uniref:extracellular solute-binding protein n=1 Tax=Paenibacillus sp. TaxID=58172 RepID=UPI0028290A9F|nr:extracellular solute-binding protein [Paenibacillus sp.]MDR0271274.1 extracellular solute-binding protein [Paenibacillus sp.]
MKKRSWITMLMALVLTTSIVGCSKGDQADSADGGKPIDITIGTMTFGESPSSDLESIQQLNEKLGVKLKIDFYPINNYKEKLNALLASKSLPDVVLIEDINDPTFSTAIEQGAFWDLTPYFKDYPNLTNYPQNAIDNVKVDGKSYGIPRVRPLDGHESFLIRQDWLDNLGLKAPTTMDELYTVLEAFTKNDPDKNGKQDTFGMVQASVSGYMMSMFGAGNQWKETADGGIEPYWMTGEAKTSLEFWSKAFKDGLIMPDLPVMKSSQVKEMLTQGKAGLAFGNVNDGFVYEQELQKIKPEAKLTAYELPVAPDGKKYYDQANGSYGVFLVSKSVSEDKLKKILELYNETATEESYNLVTYGIKDKDYTVNAEGIIEQTEEGKSKAYGTATSAQWISGYYNKYQRAEAPGMSAEVKEYNRQLIDSISESSVNNPAAGLPNTKAWMEKGGDWQKKFVDMFTNVVINKASMADWDKFTNDLRADSSFQQHLTDMSEAYKAAK